MRISKSHCVWSLLAVTLLLLMGAVVCSIMQARQQTAISRIEQLGGRVLTTQGGPVWLRRLVGNRAMRPFDRATLVNLSETDAEDADLELLTRLRGVERLNLSGTRITDEGLSRVAELHGLKALDLSGTEVTDAGLMHLTRLTELEYLYVDGTRVTNAGRNRQ